MATMASAARAATTTYRGTALASLHPTNMAPDASFSSRTRAVLALRRIGCIHVEPAPPSKPLHYTVQVFYKNSSNHIATSRAQSSSPWEELPNRNKNTGKKKKACHTHHQERPADVTVDKSLPELMALRDHLFQLARVGHTLESDPCAFCRGMIFHCGYANCKPHWSMTWLHSTGSVCEKLTRFVEDALALVVQVRAFPNHQCAGQDRTPQLLYRFFQLRESSRRNGASSSVGEVEVA